MFFPTIFSIGSSYIHLICNCESEIKSKINAIIKISEQKKIVQTKMPFLKSNSQCNRTKLPNKKMSPNRKEEEKKKKKNEPTSLT